MKISLEFWQWASIGLDNGLAPNRRQAIIWTNVDPIHWRMYAALGRDELNVMESLIQRNPSIKATQDYGLSKEVACHEG